MNQELATIDSVELQAEADQFQKTFHEIRSEVGQVIVGQLLCVGLLLASPRPSLLLISLVMAGVVVTSELVGGAARLAMPMARERRGHWRNAGVGGAVAAVAFVAIAAAGRLSGPTGILATALAAAGCVALAMALVRRT